jgi:hypothetical protein
MTEIRRATLDDAEVIGALTADAYREHVDGDYLDEPRDAQRARRRSRG